MKSIKVTLSALLFALVCITSNISKAQLPNELPLWPDGIKNNPVKYTEEKMRTSDVNESSLSKMNRVFSNVSEPTYMIFRPEKDKINGVALVICPGGGFRDVWLDREGVDFALWLADKGITSLVLKYRTYNTDNEGFALKREVYNGEVYADAKQAINILRNQSEQLGIDKNKVGIGGFSAGGALSLFAALETYEDILPSYTKFKQSTLPDFACLIYPGISDVVFDKIKKSGKIPPIFIVNGAQDNVTPAANCIKLYNALTEKNVRTELHIYSKGGHGFDSGIGRGYTLDGCPRDPARDSPFGGCRAGGDSTLAID